MSIVPRTANQRLYQRLLEDFSVPVVIAVGPAGCGKSLMACQAGAHMLSHKRVQRIVLTRPAVSTEQHGFLPGTIERKMDPWVRPLFDALRRFYTARDIRFMMEDQTIEVCPIGYMRGRTFDNAWIIADEMQNSTPAQMQMALTRIGNDSKMVITGDPNQSDIAFDGLRDVIDRLNFKELTSVQYMCMTNADVQRSEAVREILKLYSQ